MKNRMLLLLVFVCTMGIVSQAQVQNKDSMVHRIFSLFKNKDEEGFVKLFPDAQATRNFVRSVFSRDSDKVIMLPMLETMLEKITDEQLQKTSRTTYQSAIAEAEGYGVNWNLATVQSYTADSVFADDELMPVSMLSGKIYFTSDTAQFVLLYSKVIWFENKGWYGAGIDLIAPKHREYEMEVLKENIISVDTAVMIEPSAPPQKPAPTKPGTKQAPSKTTTKSTTPARKPGE
ncbi:MAG: hypothetical protein NTW29_09325 [Bacteroidetes bacterium]|nr:hypothetical protein [Bacteroidota bacterium]